MIGHQRGSQGRRDARAEACASGRWRMQIPLVLIPALLGLVACANTDDPGTTSVHDQSTGAATQAIAPPPTASALTGQRGQGLPYEIVDSEVWNVPDPVSGRDYQVFVAVPAAYAEPPERRYPVLYVTDAEYAFPVVRSIARRLNVEGPAIEDFIVVGLSYSLGESAMRSRRRDYTPTTPRHGQPAGGDLHGEAVAYADYLRDQVIAFVAERYRSDENRRLLLGHSYGSLLAAQILFTQPDLFAGYVLGSPSFWYDSNVIDDIERAYAAAHSDLPASVYMYVGEYESPAFGKRYDMVADARAMAATLAARNYPSLRLKLDVLADEDHLSVAPRGFSHGLKFLLGVE